MTSSTGSPWQPNYITSEDQDQSAITIKLWEYFSSAAAGVCQLYKSKLDQCADFQCLMDALSPMDQFFRGSQLAIGAATRNGKAMGARCLRLQLRDVAFASTQTHTTDNGVEVVVPLDVLLARELGRRICPSSGLLGKRRKSSHSGSCRTTSRCRHKRRRVRSVRTSYSPANSDQLCIPKDVDRYHKSALEKPLTTDEPKTPNLIYLGRDDQQTPRRMTLSGPAPISRRRRLYDTLATYSPPLHDCVQSCENDRYQASLSRDSFDMFQDAVHVTNLLDPLSKFSVTTEHEDVVEVPPKRLCRDSSVWLPIDDGKLHNETRDL